MINRQGIKRAINKSKSVGRKTLIKYINDFNLNVDTSVNDKLVFLGIPKTAVVHLVRQSAEGKEQKFVTCLFIFVLSCGNKYTSSHFETPLFAVENCRNLK